MANKSKKRVEQHVTAAPPAGGANRAGNKKPNSIKGLSINAWLLIIAAAVVISGYILYAPSIKYDVTNFDDPYYVTNNTGIRDLSGKGVSHLFKTFTAGNYHPITMLSYAFDYHAAGNKPYIYHRDSVILHILACLAITMLTWLLTRNLTMTAFCGLLSVMHPMNVESVEWVSGRKHLLMGLFYFLALIAWYYYCTAHKNRILLYVSCILFFALSALSLAMAVSFPISLLLIDYYLKRPLKFNLILEKAPFFILSVIIGIVAIKAQSSFGAIEVREPYNLLDRICYASFAMLDYLRKLVFPFDLSMYYMYPEKVHGSLPAIWYIYPVLAIGLLFLLYRFGRKNKDIVFGFLFFLSAIALVLQLLPVGSAISADRYAYVSYFGLFFVLASFLKNAMLGVPSWIRPLKPALPFIAAAWLIYIGYTTSEQGKIWENSVTLFKDAISKQPNYPTAYKNLGLELAKEHKYDEALSIFTQAITAMPGFNMPYVVRGDVYRNQGKLDAALADYNKAIQLKTTDPDVYMGRAIVYSMQNKFDSAGKDFTKTLALNPTSAASYLNRGNYYIMRNNFDSAIADYNRTIALDPDMESAYINRGWALVNHKEYDAGLTDINYYLSVKPESADGFIKRSYTEHYKGENTNALQDAQTAKRLGYNVDPVYMQQLENGK
jgi:tetratricopeptide (TPR) repeat protein